MQFEHETEVLKFQTHTKLQANKKKVNHNPTLLAYDLAGINFQEDPDAQSPSSTASSSDHSSSKASPNTEKSKTAFQNLLAQSCLGEDLVALRKDVNLGH